VPDTRVALEQIETATDALLRREEIVTLAAGAGEYVQRADVIRRGDGRTVSAVAHAPRYSTVELLTTEQRVIVGVLKGDGVGIADEAALDRALQVRPTLGADQATMVRRLCRHGDGVQVPPGTGKTFALDAAREAWQVLRLRGLWRGGRAPGGSRTVGRRGPSRARAWRRCWASCAAAPNGASRREVC